MISFSREIAHSLALYPISRGRGRLWTNSYLGTSACARRFRLGGCNPFPKSLHSTGHTTYKTKTLGRGICTNRPPKACKVGSGVQRPTSESQGIYFTKKYILITKMQKTQETFISMKLNELVLCGADNDYTKKLKRVSTETIRSALTEKYMSGADMKAVLCLLSTAVMASCTKRSEDGIYMVGEGVNEWIKGMKRMKVKSVEGFVYVTDLFAKDIEVITKVPQEASSGSNTDSVREYFLGIMAINGLRYTIPTFVYTLGAFVCGQPVQRSDGSVMQLCKRKSPESMFVVYEKIDGGSVHQALKSGWDFPRWLRFLAQLLLGLEVAQREIRFTHFDIHDSNVMVRRNNEPYSVHLDGTTYTVGADQESPVVIDFGMSSAFVDGKCIGSYGYAGHGMLSFMVPGFDMYKFMVYSARTAYSASKSGLKAESSVGEDIANIFRFYGSSDPYRISETREKGIKKAGVEFCRDVTYSPAATKTPLMLFNWLMGEYPDILKENSSIEVVPRTEYTSIRYSSTVQEYEDIFDLHEDGKRKAVDQIDKCISSFTPSYITTMYNLRLLEGYNQHLESEEISSRIDALLGYLEYSEQLIELDKKTLTNVFCDVKLPDPSILESRCKMVLSVSIRHGSAQEKLRHVADLKSILEYREALAPYLQMYYTILGLGLDEVFSEWLERFTSSPMFSFSRKYESLAEQASRWAKTMECSVSNAN